MEDTIDEENMIIKGSHREKTQLSYLEIQDISHLLLQKRSNIHPFTHKNWRESYYFNATDGARELSMITTIGILPNRKRSSGFVIIIHKERIAVIKFLFERGMRWHDTDRCRIGGLSHRVEGIDWRLCYESKKCKFDILFRPVNKFYSYETDGNTDSNGSFGMLFSQHIEQAGIFAGEIELNGNRMEFGPAPGHRDHSWGIRHWPAVDSYWLSSVTFGKDRAFNLWKGSSQGRSFHNGYHHTGGRNLRIVASEIRGQYTDSSREPKACEITFRDEVGGRHRVNCRVVCSVPIPLSRCIVYETIARMELGCETGFGLLEHLVHNVNPISKARALAKIRSRKRRGT